MGPYVCLYVLEEMEHKKVNRNFPTTHESKREETDKLSTTQFHLNHGVCFLLQVLSVPGSAGPCCAAAPETLWLLWPCPTARSVPERAGSAKEEENHGVIITRSSNKTTQGHVDLRPESPQPPRFLLSGLGHLSDIHTSRY